MIQSIFVLDSHGIILIEKHYRGVSSRHLIELFWDFVQKFAPFVSEAPPVHSTPRASLIHVQVNGLFIVAVVPQETNPVEVVAFLNAFVKLLRSYVGEINELSVKANFMTIYLVLDHLIDGGTPFVLEPNVIQDLVAVPNILNRTQSLVMGPGSNVAEALPDGILTGIPWRRTPVKYATNEIYLDMIEDIGGIIDGQTGQTLLADIVGRVQVDSQLSGVPDLLLKLSNPGIFDDVCFHPCVRLNRFQREKVVSFVPPDGKFQLLQYRTGGDIRLPMYVKPQVTFGEGSGRVHIMIGSKHVTDKAIEDIVVVIPFSEEYVGTSISSKDGLVEFDETTKVCRWVIKSMLPADNPVLEGNFRYEGVAKPPKPVVQFSFRTQGWLASGQKVDSLTLLNESYNHFKGVKLIARGVDLEVRL